MHAEAGAAIRTKIYKGSYLMHEPPDVLSIVSFRNTPARAWAVCENVQSPGDIPTS